MREISYTVPAEFDGVQAQVFLKSRGISRRVLTALKRSGGLTRGGGILRTVDAVHAGEVITLQLDGGETSVAANPELSADIVYEDEDVVVFNKPPFMPVHPSQRHHDDTLANLFAARYPGLPFRPINRLDRNTSGLCVCAKNQFAAAALSGSISKVYYAITDGTPPGDTVDAPIGRLGDSVIERCVTPDGKPAVTHFRKIAGERRALLRITLETGRTHQIRVHMAHIGFPLCGDDMYGGDCTAISRQALHCGEVEFTLPVSGERITISAPLPEDMAAILDGTNERT
ncbi:MAG TPA: RluA family pseudouridine synthase [Ruminococcaceae bacterium]|nr:RluA family pseudouridine synthase [Oscillospiraceae bacterium]